MRKITSSKTRVKPIMEALYERDRAGAGCLLPVLQMASRDGTTHTPHTTGNLIYPPFYEMHVEAPRPFLKWLIENPEKLSPPSASVIARWCAVTRMKRIKLMEGDSAMVNEALS